MVNQFFSTAKIRTFAPWIQDRANSLCERFNREFRVASEDEGKNKEKILNLTDAFTCLTADTIMEYSFAEHYDLCSKKDFKSDLIKILVVFFNEIHVLINFPSLLYLQMAVLPRWFVLWLDPVNRVIFSYLDVCLLLFKFLISSQLLPPTFVFLLESLNTSNMDYTSSLTELPRAEPPSSNHHNSLWHIAISPKRLAPHHLRRYSFRQESATSREISREAL
tara:strand:+ start:108 stop:770 length:663 start_codon:yes stop_codon:yes gene_type:complete